MAHSIVAFAFDDASDNTSELSPQSEPSHFSSLHKNKDWSAQVLSSQETLFSHKGHRQFLMVIEWPSQIPMADVVSYYHSGFARDAKRARQESLRSRDLNSEIDSKIVKFGSTDIAEVQTSFSQNGYSVLTTERIWAEKSRVVQLVFMSYSGAPPDPLHQAGELDEIQNQLLSGNQKSSASLRLFNLLGIHEALAAGPEAISAQRNPVVNNSNAGSPQVDATHDPACASVKNKADLISGPKRPAVDWTSIGNCMAGKEQGILEVDQEIMKKGMAVVRATGKVLQPAFAKGLQLNCPSVDAALAPLAGTPLGHACWYIAGGLASFDATQKFVTEHRDQINSNFQQMTGATVAGTMNYIQAGLQAGCNPLSIGCAQTIAAKYALVHHQEIAQATARAASILWNKVSTAAEHIYNSELTQLTGFTCLKPGLQARAFCAYVSKLETKTTIAVAGVVGGAFVGADEAGAAAILARLGLGAAKEIVEEEVGAVAADVAPKVIATVAKKAVRPKWQQDLIDGYTRIFGNSDRRVLTEADKLKDLEEREAAAKALLGKKELSQVEKDAVKATHEICPQGPTVATAAGKIFSPQCIIAKGRACMAAFSKDQCKVLMDAHVLGNFSDADEAALAKAMDHPVPSRTPQVPATEDPAVAAQNARDFRQQASHIADQVAHGEQPWTAAVREQYQRASFRAGEDQLTVAKTGKDLMKYRESVDSYINAGKPEDAAHAYEIAIQNGASYAGTSNPASYDDALYYLRHLESDARHRIAEGNPMAKSQLETVQKTIAKLEADQARAAAAKVAPQAVAHGAEVAPKVPPVPHEPPPPAPHVPEPVVHPPTPEEIAAAKEKALSDQIARTPERDAINRSNELRLAGDHEGASRYMEKAIQDQRARNPNWIPSYENDRSVFTAIDESLQGSGKVAIDIVRQEAQFAKGDRLNKLVIDMMQGGIGHITIRESNHEGVLALARFLKDPEIFNRLYSPQQDYIRNLLRHAEAFSP